MRPSNLPRAFPEASWRSLADLPAVESWQVDSAAFETLSMPKQVNYGVFLAFYTFFILVGEVRLLNLTCSSRCL